MERSVVLALSILAFGCSSSSDFHPTDSDIDKVETALVHSKCVGDLNQWRRTYVRMANVSDAEYYAAEREKRRVRPVFDKRMIEFTLEKADGSSIVAGRRRPDDYTDWEIGKGCAEPDCLFGGYALPLKQLLLECEASPTP